ncbi:MAG: hypothetical protein HDT42_06365 [Ruminococcaceae bacterium]|nr:hypothetical protein [Oscillospiraceae bacterium]
MNIREEARIIIDNFSEEQLEAFVTLFKPLVGDKTVFSEELVTVEVELPKWLADKVDELGIDLSEVLIKSLKKELGIE